MVILKCLVLITKLLRVVKVFLFVLYQKNLGKYTILIIPNIKPNELFIINSFFKISPYRLAFSSDPKLIETVTEGVKHILQSCLLAGTVQTVVITSRDFDNLYGGNITLQYVVKFMSFFLLYKNNNPLL